MHGTPAYPPDFPAFSYVNPDAPKGGTLRLTVTGGFDTLNPHVVKGVPAAGLSYVFETLMARSWDEPFSLYPLLARRISVPPDRSVLTVFLDPAARWHDGTPVTADDVLFSLQVQRDHGTPNRRQYYSMVASAERIDAATVRFTFTPQADGTYDRELPLLMGLMPIHQKAWWQGRDFSRTTLDPPMGSGPYRIETVEPGRRITYVRDPGYWGRDRPTRRGLFNADRVVFDYYRDETISLQAFLAGEADVRRESDPGRWADGYTGPALAAGRILREDLPHRRPETARGLILNTRRPLFADRRVRAALGLAVDAAWMNRTFFHNALTRTASYYPNSELAATDLPTGLERAALEPLRPLLPPEVFTHPYTPPGGGDRAALRDAFARLTAAGWRLKGGRLEDGAGQPFAFEILLGTPGDEREAQEIARGLGRLGISAAVRTVDSAQYQTRLDSYDFDTTIRGWTSSLSPGNEQLYYFGSAAADTPGSRNLPGIRDPAVDALAASLAHAASREELVARVRALDRVLLWGEYMIPLFHDTADHMARWSHIHRPDVTPLYGPVIDAWWVGGR